MYYVFRPDLKHALAKYTNWLNIDDCKFHPREKNPWTTDKDFSVILSLEEPQDEKLSDFFLCGNLRIVSQRFRDLLLSFSGPEDLEFVNVRIFCGEKEYNYYALHIRRFIDGVDKEKSVFVGLKYGLVAGITLLSLDPARLEGSNVFVLENTWEIISVLSEDVVSEIKNSGLIGVEVIECSKYREDTRGI